MEHTDILGYVAAALTTFSFLPQAVKVIKTRDTKSISLVMYVAFTIGVLFWNIYGILINNYPMMFANAITLVFASIILFFKLKDIKK